MKRIIFSAGLTVLLLVGFTVNSYSQFILAGEHHSGNFFYDIIPDTTLTGPNNHIKPDPPAVYRIDIDGDGVLDFYLYAVGFWVNGMGYTTIAIKSYDTNYNQIAFGYYDTCQYVYTDTTVNILREMARSFKMNDSINGNLAWSKNIGLYLAYTDWKLKSTYCEDNGFENDSLGNYIAVRMCRPNDTVYGWIKVTDIHYLTFTVQEFASTQTVPGIDEPDATIHVFPVPVCQDVEVETRFSDYDLFVYNQFGKEIVQKKHLSRNFQLHLGNQGAGVYIIKMVSENTVIVRKILKQ